MTDITVTIDVDSHLHKASSQALIREINHRRGTDVVELISKMKSEIISWADNESLIDELEDRGFKVSRNKDDDDWCEIRFHEWDELANLIATGQNREALELVEYISNGFVNAVCAANHALMLNQERHPQ